MKYEYQKGDDDSGCIGPVERTRFLHFVCQGLLFGSVQSGCSGRGASPGRRVSGVFFVRFFVIPEPDHWFFPAGCCRCCFRGAGLFTKGGLEEYTSGFPSCGLLVCCLLLVITKSM